MYVFFCQCSYLFLWTPERVAVLVTENGDPNKNKRFTPSLIHKVQTALVSINACTVHKREGQTASH